MPKFFLHIGPDKTGSSKIQQFLARNATALAERGYRYAGSGYNQDQADGAILSGNGFPLFLAVAEGLDFQGIVEDMTATRDDVVVSCEHLATLPAPAIASVAEAVVRRDFDFRLVYYARAPLDRLVSAICQSVRRSAGVRHPAVVVRNNTGNLRKHFPRYDLRAVLDALSESIGRERMIVRAFAPGAFAGGTIEADFLDAIGLGPDGFVFEPGPLNPAPTLPELRLLLAVNNRRPDAALSRRISDAIIAERMANPDVYFGPRVGIPAEVAEAAAKELAADVDYLRRDYGLAELEPFTSETVQSPPEKQADLFRLFAAAIDGAADGGDG